MTYWKARNSKFMYICSGGMRVMAANNDAQIRIFDAETFAGLNRFSFDWSVNVSASLLKPDLDFWLSSISFHVQICMAVISFQNTSVSPDGKLLAVLGDSVECLIADTQSGKVCDSFQDSTYLVHFEV